tara:strand:+ start:627 stop:2036 length:1410 start_codon:yes stop_codon:yes gene_type:complete
VNLNVELEDLGPCKKQLRFNLPAEDVGVVINEVTKQFQKEANISGFRKGKAPLGKVEARFKQQIEQETKNKLLRDSFRKGIEDNKLRLLYEPEVDPADVQFGRGDPFSFLVNVETVPDFELPDYKAIPTESPKINVTDKDVESAINHLREGRAEYKSQDREARDGDYINVSFTGTIDGQPVTDFSATARGLTEQKSMPLHVHAEAEHDHFIPNFTGQLIGSKKGESKTIEVTFPDEYPAQPKLQGLKAIYEVTIDEVKEKVLPELNDEFAKSWEAENLDKLLTGVKEDLEANQKGQATQMVRMQAKKAYIEKLTFDVPSSIREQEMQSEIQSIVRRRRAQGDSEEKVEKDKDQITAEANGSAIDNLRWYFAHKRIAEEEKVEVSKEDVLGVVAMQAQQTGRDPQEYIKELAEKKQIGYIQNQLLESKVIDLIAKHADITEIEPLKQEANPPAKDDTGDCCEDGTGDCCD